MLIEQIGEFTPDNIVNSLLESESNWRAVRRYVECVLPREMVVLDDTVR